MSLPARPYLIALSRRFWNSWASSSRSPSTSGRSGGISSRMRMSRSPARNSSVSARWRSSGPSATRPCGMTCSLSSIRDSDSRSSTSRVMRAACCVHDREKPLARLGILARRSAQGLDKAGQGGERGAQLVARIGDEVGAHLLGPFQLGDVVQGQHRDRTVERRAVDAGEARLQLPLDRDASPRNRRPAPPRRAIPRRPPPAPQGCAAPRQGRAARRPDRQRMPPARWRGRPAAGHRAGSADRGPRR